MVDRVDLAKHNLSNHNLSDELNMIRKLFYRNIYYFIYLSPFIISV